MLALALIAASVVPQPAPVVRESVELTERNFFYDDNGRLVFEQAIFQEANKQGDDEIIGWRLIKHQSQIPQRDWDTGGYRCLWMDGEVMREVYCKFIRETHFQFDPELSQREILAKDKRRELRSPKGYK